MPVGFITHPDCALHDMGPLHPESPARLHAIADQLIASGLDAALRHFDAPAATHEQLCRVHSARHVEYIFSRAPKQGLIRIDADTSMNPHTLDAALRAAGAGIMAVDLIMDASLDAAFCSVRPPGHHAERDGAMGFCFFNNIAVAAAHALESHGLERVAIVDFDVHHGNGTEDIFKDDARVLLCSTFQHPFYPGSGADTQSNHIVNVPLDFGSGSKVFQQGVSEFWLPALQEHRPQLILVSAGFDAHVEDEMSGLGLVDEDYSWVTTQLRNVADQYCQGHIVSVLEGGYALNALGRSVVTHIKALL